MTADERPPQRRAFLIVRYAKRGARWQSLAGGLDVANHRDGLKAQRSQPVHNRAAYMPGSAGDEDQF